MGPSSSDCLPHPFVISTESLERAGTLGAHEPTFGTETNVHDRGARHTRKQTQNLPEQTLHSRCCQLLYHGRWTEATVTFTVSRIAHKRTKQPTQEFLLHLLVPDQKRPEEVHICTFFPHLARTQYPPIMIDGCAIFEILPGGGAGGLAALAGQIQGGSIDTSARQEDARAFASLRLADAAGRT